MADEEKIAENKTPPPPNESWWSALMDPEEPLPMAWLPTKLGLLPPHDRATVEKVRVSEREATNRKAVEEREATKRKRAEEHGLTTRSDGYQIVRGLWAIVILIVSIIAGAQACTAVGAWKEVRLKDIDSRAPRPPVTFTLTPSPANSR